MEILIFVVISRNKRYENASRKNEKFLWINYENHENFSPAISFADYSDGNGNVSGGESEDEDKNVKKEETNVSTDNEIPLYTHQEHHNEIETTQAPSRENLTLPCASDRGGCDHECQMVKYYYDPEPIIQCSCYKGFTLDEYDGRRCHGE